MVASTLSVGDVAIIGFNTGQDNESPAQAATQDKLYFVLLKPIGSGTTIYITDRSWNGTVFASAGGDGTFTYTAGADIPAGTVITITQAQLTAAGMDIDHVGGDTFYVYQGTNSNTPTNFLFAAEFADSSAGFQASLVNTGLVVGVSAVAVAFDSGAYTGPTTFAESFMWNGNGSTLLTSIADSTNWVGDDSTGDNAREQEVQNGPWLKHADVEFWGTMGSGGLANTLADATFAGGADDYNHTRQYDGMLYPSGPNAGTNVFNSLRDIVFDTVDGKFFVTDSNISGVNRILQGNISDLLANPSGVPNLTVLFTYTQAAGDPTDLSGRLDNMELDVANNIVYFTKGDDLYKVNYDTANQAGTLLFQANVTAATSPSGVGNPAGSTSNFYNDMVIDFSTGKIYLSSTRVVSGASDQVSKNFIYELNGLTTGSGANAFTFNASNTGTARLLPFAQNDDAYNPGGSAANSPSTAANAAFFLAQEFGSLDGLALDPVNHILYFSTGEILFDHDLNSGTPVQYIGGIMGQYNLTGNPTGVHTVLYQQTAQFGGAIPGLMGDLEIDLQNGHLYVLDYAGVNGVNDDNHWFRMNIGGSTPIQFTQTIGDPDGFATVGFTLNHAPTLSGTGNGGLALTEVSIAPNSGETGKVTLFNSIVIGDVDTSTADELTGAVIRIGEGFTFEASSTAPGHTGTVDRLYINNLTSGTIAGSGISFAYNQTTGAMVLTGAATVAEYKAAIELVQFSTSGDNVTNNGNGVTRTIYVSVSDGLTMSDEVSATVSITGINDAPVNVVATPSVSFVEDSVGTAGQAVPSVIAPANAITGLSITDADADATTETFTVTLSVLHGTLTVRTDATGGITGAMIVGGANGSSTITISATQNQINATLAATTAPAQGSLANGLVYTPILDYHGADTLTIVTNDQGNNGNDPGNSGTGTTEADTDTVAITVTPVVDIANDTVNNTEDSGTLTLNLLANDTFENSNRSITAVSSASHGTVTINNNATPGDTTDDFVQYTPTADYNGTDSFTYTVTSGGATETATVNVTLSAVVDIANDNATVNEDSGATTINVLANDTFENAGRSITAVTQGTNGTVAINNNGTAGDTSDDFVQYTPNADYNGSDSFTYTVTSGGVNETATVNVTVTAVADIVDDSPTVLEDSGANVIDVLGNDTFESAARFISAVTQPANGAVAIVDGPDADGINDYVTFTPNAGFNGPTSFTYTVTSGGVTETATVSMTVTAVNDAPTSANLNGDSVTFTEGANLVLLDLGGNATVSDVDSANFDGGTLTISITGGKIAAEDDLGISVGGLSNVAVGPGNAVLVNGTQIATVTGGGAGGGDLVFTFDSDATPAAVGELMRWIAYSNQSAQNPSDGNRTITWTLVDGDGNANGGNDTLAITTTVNVDPVNDEPQGTDKTVTTSEDDAYTFTVADFGFSDPGEGDGLAGVIITTLPAAGSGVLQLSGSAVSQGVTISAADITAGNLKFVPDTDESGSPYASFTFQVVDDGGAPGVDTDQSANTMTINVTPDVGGPINGTAGDDTLTGTPDPDTMNGLGGNDIIYGQASGDTLDGGDGTDYLYGEGGNDTLTGGAGKDFLDGGAGDDNMAGGTGDDRYFVDEGDTVTETGGEGSDIVYARTSYVLTPGASVELLAAIDGSATDAIHLTGNELNNTIQGNNGGNRLLGGDGNDYLVGLGGLDVLDGGAGNDIMVGGTGNDRYYVDSGDRITELVGEGSDIAYARTSFVLTAGAEVELLAAMDGAGTDPLNLSGNAFNNTVQGNAGANTLLGFAGNDYLVGLGGSDILDGGAGADILAGGAGADSFRFSLAADSPMATPDRISDFVSGTDKIDLSPIDANSGLAGNQAFTFLGTGAFTSHAGELRYDVTGGKTHIYGDVNGDGVADLHIVLDNAAVPVSGDFLF
jgi:Ca2+-binding RTX toxin-like protein